MRKIILNNIGLKILALILAVILWIVVMNISDYNVTVKIRNIPVKQLNAEALDELDKVYDVSKGDTVDIIVKGRRSVVEKLTASDFIATADLSTMSITNSVQIFVQPVDESIESDITITCVDNTMQLNLENKVTASFPLKISYSGTTKEGYAVGETTLSTEIITVEGPESSVDKISEARININVDELDKSIVVQSEIRIYDAYDDEIHNDKIILSDRTVSATVGIYPVKEVPIVLDIKGTPAQGYGVSKNLCTPDTVLITGKPEIISEIESIDVDAVSVSGMSENYQTTMDISKYLPDGVFLAQANSEIVVNIAISKMSEKEIIPNTKSIILTNKKANYTYEVVFPEDFKVTVSGLDNDIESVDVAKMKPTIDCSDLKVGSQEVELGFTEIDGVSYKTNKMVTVIVKEK